MSGRSHVDQGRAWFVLLACTFNIAVATGVAMTCGVYVSTMIEYYGSSRAAGYVIGSLSYGFLFGTGSVASVLIDKTSHRTVAMLGGLLSCIGLILSANFSHLYYQYATTIITATGCGFIFQTSIVVIVYYFHKFRAAATAVVFAGGGVGLMIYPMICQYIIAVYSWQPSLYIVAGIALNTCVGSSFFVPFTDGCDVEDIKESEDHTILSGHIDKQNESLQLIHSNLCDIRVRENEPNVKLLKSDVEEAECVVLIDKPSSSKTYELVPNVESVSSSPKGLLRNVSFWLFLINILMWSGPCCVPLVLAADMYSKLGVAPHRQSILFMTIGLCNVIGRLGSGFIVNLKYVSTLRLYCACNFIWSIGVMLFLLHHHYVGLIIANVVFGLSFGGFISLGSLATLEIVGLKDLNRAYGLVGLTISITGVLVPPLLGMIYDSTLSYMWPVLIAAILSALSAILLVPPAFLWI